MRRRLARALRALAATIHPQPTVITVPVNIDGREVARAVVDAAKRKRDR